MSPADSLRAVLDSVFAAPAYRWIERPDPYGTLRRWFRIAQQWLFDLRDGNPLLFRLVVAGLIVLVLAAFAHAGWILYRTLRAAGRPLAPLPAGTEARRDESWYRREADRLAGAGRFAEAMQYDFLALVLALDRRALLRFHASKTPGEYAREARMAPESRERFRALVSSLYGYVFARRPCGAPEFTAWRGLAAAEHYAAA